MRHSSKRDNQHACGMSPVSLAQLVLSRNVKAVLYTLEDQHGFFKASMLCHLEREVLLEALRAARHRFQMRPNDGSCLRLA